MKRRVCNTYWNTVHYKFAIYCSYCRDSENCLPQKGKPNRDVEAGQHRNHKHPVSMKCCSGQIVTKGRVRSLMSITEALLENPNSFLKQFVASPFAKWPLGLHNFVEQAQNVFYCLPNIIFGETGFSAVAVVLSKQINNEKNTERRMHDYFLVTPRLIWSNL